MAKGLTGKKLKPDCFGHIVNPDLKPYLLPLIHQINWFWYKTGSGY